MKRLFIALLVMSLLFTTVGCEKAEPTNANPAVIVPDVEDNTMGANLWDAFYELMEKNAKATPEDVANDIIANEEIFPYDGGVMAVKPGYLTGFEEHKIMGFEECVVFMPTISIVPFIGYVFVVEEDTKVDAFVSELKKFCNRRWTISTQAEQVVIGAYGNTVLFVMCPEAPDGAFGSRW